MVWVPNVLSGLFGLKHFLQLRTMCSVPSGHACCCRLVETEGIWPFSWPYRAFKWLCQSMFREPFLTWPFSETSTWLQVLHLLFAGSTAKLAGLTSSNTCTLFVSAFPFFFLRTQLGCKILKQDNKIKFLLPTFIELLLYTMESKV